MCLLYPEQCPGLPIVQSFPPGVGKNSQQSSQTSVSGQSCDLGASSDDVLQSHFIYGASDFLVWPIGHCISHNFSLSLFKIGSWLHPSGLLTFFLHCSSCWSLISSPFPFRDYILFITCYSLFTFLFSFFLLNSLQILFGDAFKYCKYKYIPNGAVGSYCSKLRAFHCSVNIWIRNRNQKLGMLIYDRSNLLPCLLWSNGAEGKIT